MKYSKSKDGWLIYKIDIAKAFDSISWNFIENILSPYHFPLEFNTLILSCLKKVTYTPIVPPLEELDKETC